MSLHRVTAASSTRRLAGLGVLVLALLWAQLLGLAHGVRHAVPRAPGAGLPATAQAAAVGQDLLAHLAAPAGQEDDCRLYDQLGHGGLPAFVPVLAVAVLPVGRAWPPLALQPTTPCASYAARAPPVSR